MDERSLLKQYYFTVLFDKISKNLISLVVSFLMHNWVIILCSSILDSSLYILYDKILVLLSTINILFVFVYRLENSTPAMKDLNTYVVQEHAIEWEEIGLELELELCVLENIAKDNSQQNVMCFKETLKKWLRSSPIATWRKLEIAITNVRRQTLQLDPIDDLYGENSHT